MRMKLAWLAITRPYFLFNIFQLSQVTESSFDENRKSVIKLLNSIVKDAIENHVSLAIPKIDLDTVCYVEY